MLIGCYFARYALDLCFRVQEFHFLFFLLGLAELVSNVRQANTDFGSSMDVATLWQSAELSACWSGYFNENLRADKSHANLLGPPFNPSIIHHNQLRLAHHVWANHC